jgi:predicted phosphodiesterase
MAIRSELARQYRDKYKNTPTLTLARIMYNENAEVFKDVEQARSDLRYIEGKHGARMRKSVINTPHYMEQSRPKNPYKLPESEEIDFKPYQIKGVKRLAVFNDIHVPYHSITALTAAIEHTKDCDALLINGDLIDFYGLSRFMKDPRKRSVSHELKACNELLDVLQKHYKKIYFKLGNHDVRFEHYLMMKAPELLGIAEFELSYLLKCKERGIEVIKDKTIIKVNSLNIIHGHEFGGSVFSPVNIARGLFLRGKTSAMQGHNHQTSEHTEPNMNGEITTTWSVGCLSELHPEYLPINKWNHGFAIVEVKDKEFHVINKRIYKGRVL